jgi:hypothetical protein
VGRSAIIWCSGFLLIFLHVTQWKIVDDINRFAPIIQTPADLMAQSVK